MIERLVLFALIGCAVWLLVRKPAKRLPLGESEAREILGVSTTADAEAIRAAHRRLVNAVHPDKGGSAELTRRINAARDTLIGR
jgi:DnaJ family protein C protein 19